MDIFDAISPLDYRYYGRSENIKKELSRFLSENARIKYQLKVEAALAKVLYKKGICTEDAANEIIKACQSVTAKEVYEEEDRIKHDIRALVNCIRKRVSDEAKPFVHFSATSFDIINTADSLRYKEFVEQVLVKVLLEFEKTLISIAEREKNTVQAGRTHGQHAEPVTFGFAVAEYVSRLGNCIIRIKDSARNLKGKFSGAVGAYNAASLFFDDPEGFEKDILKELGLSPATHSTQIVEPEYMLDFVYSVISCFGVLANLADDMRHLQRSEIGEVAEMFKSVQVGSSTMPHKRNPINFENVKSMWKVFFPRINTLFMDQISEHQRDLTNSASSRFIPEILAGLYVSVKRMNKVMKNIVVDKENIRKNFEMSKDMIIAEPLYILLAANGHPNAHEYVKQLTLESQKTGKSLREIVMNDKNLKPYINKLKPEQREILENPEKYIGIASRKTENVCKYWRKRLGI